MKRILVVVVLAAFALALGACGGPSIAPPGGAPGGSATTTDAAVPTTQTWAAMPMGAQEQAALAGIPAKIAAYEVAEDKAGRKPIALAGKTPRFVGYQVKIYSKQADAKYSIGLVEVIGGRVVALSDMQIPLKAAMVSISKDQPGYFPSGVAPLSPGEQEAVGKAAAWADASFPVAKWSAEVSGYEFYFPTGKGKYVLFTAVEPAGWRALPGPMGVSED